VRARGFDHGALLARIVGRCLQVPVAETIERGRGASLTGRSAGERAGGPPLRPRPAADRAWPLLGATVLLVDDVITTGATLSSAARQLRQMGAASVIGVTAAYTPLTTSWETPGDT
jgi:predicted amidophosphoribosyltransferase